MNLNDYSPYLKLCKTPPFSYKKNVFSWNNLLLNNSSIIYFYKRSCFSKAFLKIDQNKEYWMLYTYYDNKISNVGNAKEEPAKIIEACWKTINNMKSVREES